MLSQEHGECRRHVVTGVLSSYCCRSVTSVVVVLSQEHDESSSCCDTSVVVVLSQERDECCRRVAELVEENGRLEFEKKSSFNESASLEEELQRSRLEANCSGQSSRPVDPRAYSAPSTPRYSPPHPGSLQPAPCGKSYAEMAVTFASRGISEDVSWLLRPFSSYSAAITCLLGAVCMKQQ